MKPKYVLAPTPLLMLLFMMLSGPTAFADDDAVPRELLTCQFEYWSVGHL